VGTQEQAFASSVSQATHASAAAATSALEALVASLNTQATELTGFAQKQRAAAEAAGAAVRALANGACDSLKGGGDVLQCLCGDRCVAMDGDQKVCCHHVNVAPVAQLCLTEGSGLERGWYGCVAGWCH